MKLTKNEEDYLKALFHLIGESEEATASTTGLADYLGVSPSSVNNMLKKLKLKELVDYRKYGKLELTAAGKQQAVLLIRKHRLWETFLYKYMNFSWDEVHEVAEQLEHIKSAKLIKELDRFMGFPKQDPHGDYIPDESGSFKNVQKTTLSELKAGEQCRLVSVKDNSAAFLRYVTELGLALSSRILVEEVREFDGSLSISFNDVRENVSRHFAEHIYVERIS